MNITKEIMHDIKKEEFTDERVINGKRYCIWIYGRFESPTEYMFDAEALELLSDVKGPMISNVESKEKAITEACLACENAVKLAGKF